MCKTVLLTGASGMIGSHATRAMIEMGYRVIGVDCSKPDFAHERYEHFTMDISNSTELEDVFDKTKPDRVVHLAALAHTRSGEDFSYQQYYDVNVTCAEAVFIAAAKRLVPVLHVSTADVYGFVKGVATKDTPLAPVSFYGKTKAIAETRLKQICEEHKSNYTIFRFQPVYTPEIKRDIQKRYYLKYPNIAYVVGKGQLYEVLSVYTAVARILEWIEGNSCNDIYNVKDEQLLDVNECIKGEREKGLAKHVIRVPRWLAVTGFTVLKVLTGRNKYTYLLNKAVNPLRTE